MLQVKADCPADAKMGYQCDTSDMCILCIETPYAMNEEQIV